MIRQEAHHNYCDCGTYKEVRQATAETGARAVARRAYYRLHYKPHERGQNPKITEVVGIGSDSGENSAHLRALQGISYLYAEEPETKVP